MTASPTLHHRAGPIWTADTGRTGKSSRLAAAEPGLFLRLSVRPCLLGATSWRGLTCISFADAPVYGVHRLLLGLRYGVMTDWLDRLRSRTTLLYSVVICLVFAASFTYVFDKKVDLNGDNAKYYLLAQSIAEGKGYVKSFAPGAPATSIYPPGYPLLASTVMVFTDSVTAQKILNGLFLLGGALLLFLIVRRITEEDLLAFSIAVLTVVNFHLLKFSTMMMSEASFLLFSLLAIFLLMKSRGDDPVWRSPAFGGFLLALAFSFHIRTQGISLVAGVLFYFLCTRQWTRLSATALGFFLLALPWRIRNYVQEIGSSRYLDQLVQANPWRPEKGSVSLVGLLERFVDQGSMIITKGLPDSIFNFVTVNYQAAASGLEWGIGLFVLAVMGYGFWQFGTYRLLFLGYFLAVFGIVALWSATVDNRYLVTAIPIFQAGFFYGVYVLGRAAIERAGRPFEPSTVVPVAILVVGGFMLPQLNQLQARAERPYPAAYYNYFQSANELGQKEECREKLVACRKPALFYMFSGCPVTKYPSTPDETAFVRKMLREGVDYVVLAQLGYSSTRRYLYPAIKKHRNLFQVLIRKKKPDTYVFTFNRDRAQSVIESE